MVRRGQRPQPFPPQPLTEPAAEHPDGPLAVVDVEDGQVLAYCTGGLVLDVRAKSLPSLVEWTLKEAKLGQPKLSGPGKDADPLLVLTEAALERYGHAGRIPEGHKVHQAARARGLEADQARLRAVGADLPPRHRLGAGLRAAVHPVVERARHPTLGHRRTAPAGGTRPDAGRVRLAGDDAARLHGRDRPGADDRAAPADARLRAGRVPGSWLVDLSHVDLSKVEVGKEWVELDGSLLPSPFTTKGERPGGPAWYATPTVAYAAELGYEVRPLEAWVRYENGRYLDGWYNRLRDAYLATMADLGVDADLAPADFLAAMDGCKDRDPDLAIVVSAIKATVKGGLGKLRERPRGEGWRPGEPWRALSRPTWRPDIRAAVISRTRINLHRKIVQHAAFTGQYPVAILSDCVVYASNGPSPQGKPLPGGFKLGINPRLLKHEGTQSVLWGSGSPRAVQRADEADPLEWTP